MSAYYQGSDPVIEDGKIRRNEPGKGAIEYELTVNGDGLGENQRYPVKIEAQKYTNRECQELIDKAKVEIDESIFINGEEAEHVVTGINMKDSYVNKSVSAEWILSNYNIIDSEGNINSTNLDDNGELVTAEVELTCGELKELYIVTMHVYPRALSKEESLIKDINVAITTENEKVGAEYLTLPDQVDGVKLSWGLEKEHLTLKVFLLEIAGIALLIVALKRQEQENFKKRQESMRIDYAEIVSKMAILLGSGMSVKQSWNRISARNLTDKQKMDKNCRPVYEEMQITMREIEDGISERVAYQNFGDRVKLSEYYRFIRLLISNMQKGNRSICTALEEEAVAAYEQRRMLIKKMGEEAGTKMLIPLMIMLIIVMAIIMVPAILSF